MLYCGMAATSNEHVKGFLRPTFLVLFVAQKFQLELVQPLDVTVYSRN